MERRGESHRAGCSIAKQTILTSHPSGLCARVSVELASIDSVCLHRAECQGSPIKIRKDWDAGSPFSSRRGMGGVSAHGTPVLGRRSDIVTEGRMSQQCTPVMRRKDLIDSPASSPVPSRRFEDDGDEEYSVDSVISGWLKFRDNKRWKSRWGVVTKLSPAADCLHLQLYREPKDRHKRGQSKASLSLQHFLGFESGFTLDKESNTIAIICQDVIVVLALETRERLISWQVRVATQLGNPRQYLVMIGCGGGNGGGRKLPAGPARLHIQRGKFAITSGVPPRLLGLWELAHLRRYGVVEGRFCFEGGSHCGRGEGLHVLLTDQAQEITESFRLAAEGKLTPERRPTSSRKSAGGARADTRLSDFIAETGADGDSVSYEETFMREEAPETPWGDDVISERCRHRVVRSEDGGDAAADFTPAWTMEGVDECRPGSEYSSPRPVRRAPRRPPKPGRSNAANHNPKAGPYENYDVPKPVPREGDKQEYYDTPKRIKDTLIEDMFRAVAYRGAPDSLVLKKKCGCILKLGAESKHGDVDGDLKSAECPCRRVTDWASGFIGLPYCARNSNDEDAEPNDEQTAIYATVDVSRKTNRRSTDEEIVTNDATGRRKEPEDSNYENLDFAMSLEYYENAKDLLRKAGMTQSELDALSANFNIDTRGIKAKMCVECSHARSHNITKRNKSDEYLLMRPSADAEDSTLGRRDAAGYAPMSPARWSRSLNRPAKSHDEIEKSLSIPSLDDDIAQRSPSPRTRANSADSAKLPEDAKESDGGPTTPSSPETARNAATERGPSSVEFRTECRETPNLRNELIDRTRMKRTASAPCKTECNRDSSSSNDSGVSSCSLRRGGREFAEFDAPPSSARRLRIALPRVHLAVPRKSKSSELRDVLVATPARHKSSSAEAEVPVLAAKAIGGASDSRSTSSGTSDMSDYIETLSLSSGRSSRETPPLNRVIRQSTSTLRPRSGNEYTDTHTYAHLV